MMASNQNYISISNPLIKLQEEKDYYVASRFFQDLSIGKKLYLNQANFYCSVDMHGLVVGDDGNQFPFNVEIKQRNKSDEEIELYPVAELKKDKYERMEKATAAGTRLYYLTLLNSKTGYLFDMTNLDWDKVNLVNWEMKRVEYSDRDEKIVVPTYMIPYSLAKYELPLEQYYKDWYGICARG